jgi:hypothetical protein
LNVAVHVPSSEFTLPLDACSLSVICRVPSPEAPSMIEPDQLPATGRTAGVVTVGPVGVALPQPATLSIAATTGANRRVIGRSYCSHRASAVL